MSMVGSLALFNHPAAMDGTSVYLYAMPSFSTFAKCCCVNDDAVLVLATCDERHPFEGTIRWCLILSATGLGWIPMKRLNLVDDAR